MIKLVLGLVLILLSIFLGVCCLKYIPKKSLQDNIVLANICFISFLLGIICINTKNIIQIKPKLLATYKLENLDSNNFKLKHINKYYLVHNKIIPYINNKDIFNFKHNNKIVSINSNNVNIIDINEKPEFKNKENTVALIKKEYINIKSKNKNLFLYYNFYIDKNNILIKEV